jgi:hypothetical protein
MRPSSVSTLRLLFPVGPSWYQYHRTTFLGSNLFLRVFESLLLRCIVTTRPNYQVRRCAQNASGQEVRFYFILDSIFAQFTFSDFDEMPNEGVGRVAPHGNQKQTRQALLTARQERRRQSSPES